MKTTKKTINAQRLSAASGRPMLEWYGKHAPTSIEYYPAQEKEVYGNLNAKEFNKLFWGDNKQVLAHLLKEYRGKVDLIYIDPPFDSKADYVKKVKLNGEKIEGLDQSVLEQMQYTDIWEKDEYLQFIYERLIMLRELLAESGSLYVHMDENRSHYLKILLDEVFGPDNFQREIVWRIGWISGYKSTADNFIRNHDTILYYTKSNACRKFNKEYIPYPVDYVRRDGKKPEGQGYPVEDTWNASDIDRMDSIQIMSFSGEKVDYPTQKNENLLARIIRASTDAGDLVLDCFVGSGTTAAVAEKLGRRWIACDINKGAILTTTERLNKIIKQGGNKTGFKVYDVNHYDVFNNDAQARQLLIEAYRIDELKRGDFDGMLGADFVKIIPPNRVLTKLDIKQIIQMVATNIAKFTPKAHSKQKQATYENKVIIICSGAEIDARDTLRRDNNTGVDIEIRDIQVDKKNLDFKRPTEASISYAAKDMTLTVSVDDYFSPLLMKRLSLDNEARISSKSRVSLFDYRQAIEHIVIDVDYGEGQARTKSPSFNAEAFLHKEGRNGLVDVVYTHTYNKKGTYTVAVKIVDVLGEEYFETHSITIK